MNCHENFIFQTIQIYHISFALIYITNYYIFVYTITELLLTMCLTIFSANILSNTFTPIIIFGQISKAQWSYFLFTNLLVSHTPLTAKETDRENKDNFMDIIGKSAGI